MRTSQNIDKSKNIQDVLENPRITICELSEEYSITYGTIQLILTEDKRVAPGCRLRHLTEIQNYEVRPKIALVLIQNGSLVILTSRFEVTRGLIWDGHRNVEPRLDDDTWDGVPSPCFRAMPTGGRLAPTYDLACKRPNPRRIFSGIGFRTWNFPAPKLRPYH
ncbi:hypothetical protein AVEN_196922-1 [Araneus ventricosus]|uniref:Uncharacterized protein n=1 Tax=Araneus ventricosus TaxID=182803 RepID=A0A4Y2LSF6_ARAVE|nr:hypothetical protein AVEN_196922-1 [Araneus ventricosus]